MGAGAVAVVVAVVGAVAGAGAGAGAGVVAVVVAGAVAVVVAVVGAGAGSRADDMPIGSGAPTQKWWSFPTEQLAERLLWTMDAAGVEKTDQYALLSMLLPLKIKSQEHYEHSIRVGLLAYEIGLAMGLDAKALFFAGALHDVGKALVPKVTLDRTVSWSVEDQAAIEQHVADGWRLLRDRFDFTAEVIAWHHRFQKNCYPEPMPALHEYSTATSVLIPFYGRLLSMADTFDALHRVNSLGKLTGAQIHAKMLELFPDLKVTVGCLYATGVLAEMPAGAVDFGRPKEP